MMGPRRIFIPIIAGLFLLLVTSTSVVRSHSSDKQKDDLIDDESSSSEDGVFPMKLDDYEIEYKTPTPSEPVNFFETFDDIDAAKKRWITSRATKEDNENLFKYDGRWEFELPERRIFPNDRALVLRSKAKHAAISAKLDRKFEFNTKPLIVQYEVTFQNGMDCGGAYIKLLSDSKDLKLEDVYDKTPYTIMFGPDKCGSDIKLHFIFRHKNPLNGTFEEKHAKRPSNRVEDAFNDKKPHLYKLVLKPDNRFEVFVDGLLINQGSLLEDMEPPVNPPIEIEDPNDKKPADWDDREKIPDENVKKPDDWDEDAPPKIPDPAAQVPTGWLEDEPEMISDPSAKMPEDWDESMDGDWEAPLIPNPKCEEAVGCGPWTAPLVENPNFRGKWQPPMISNPNYKGQWTRRKIPNPNYFEDKEPFKMTPIGAVGLEIWTMTDMVLFDNFIISDKESVVNDFTDNTYTLKIRALERDSRGVIERIINYSNSHPWLYAVYTIVVGLPVVLIIAFCCGGGGDKKDTTATPPATEEHQEHHHHGSGENDITPPRPSRRDGPLKRSNITMTEGRAPPEHTRPDRVAPRFVAVSKDDLEEEPADEQINRANGIGVGEDAANIANEQEGEGEEVDAAQEEANENGDADEVEESEVDENQEEEGESQEELNGEVEADEVVDEMIRGPEQEAPAGLKKRRTRRD